jgi:hypothetical protein
MADCPPIHDRAENGRNLPISDIGNSFDDLVGELLELHWHIET